MGKQDNFGPLVLKFGSSDLVVEYFFFKMAKILGRCSVHKRLSKWLSGKEAACQCKRCIVTSSIPDMEDPLEKRMATYLSILAWEIPGREELAGYSP